MFWKVLPYSSVTGVSTQGLWWTVATVEQALAGSANQKKHERAVLRSGTHVRELERT